MKFSVLIALYNNSNYLRDCFQSLTSQTYNNWEAIILDDGSNAEEKAAVQKLIEGDKRFRYYENERNRGVGYTKSKLVQLAEGDICGFVDPDDAIKESAISDLISNYEDEKTVAVYSQFYLCDELLQPKKVFSDSATVNTDDPLFFNIFLEINHLFSFCKLAYDKTSGIDPTLSSSVDQDLYLKLSEVGRMKFIKKPLYLYRQHTSGVSQDLSKKKKLYENWDNVIRNAMSRRALKNVYGKEVAQIENLPTFLFEKQNTLWRRIIRKFS